MFGPTPSNLIALSTLSFHSSVKTKSIFGSKKIQCCLFVLNVFEIFSASRMGWLLVGEESPGASRHPSLILVVLYCAWRRGLLPHQPLGQSPSSVVRIFDKRLCRLRSASGTRAMRFCAPTCSRTPPLVWDPLPWRGALAPSHSITCFFTQYT